MFSIRLGVPEMEALWADLSEKARKGTLGKDEGTLYKKMGKAMTLLSNDPKHPGLHSHEIEALYTAPFCQHTFLQPFKVYHAA